MRDKARSELLEVLAQGEGILAMIAGGPMARGAQLENEHKFCEDCEEWDAPHDGREKHLYAPCRAVASPAGAVRTPFNGPLWPGCRGFKLRDGAPGPMKRVREHLEAQVRELRKREDARRTT